MTEYWGKYRGKVLDNLDPLLLARLVVDVPAVPGMLLNWAFPCVPYAGLAQGFFALPPIGADVWVEFEGGNPDYPVWTGCFWESAQLPPAASAASLGYTEVKELESQFARLVLNDTPEVGGITLSVNDPAVNVPVVLEMTSVGLSITVGAMSLLMNPEEGITLTAGDTVLALTEETISLLAASIEATAEAELNMTAATVTVESDEVNVTAVCSVEGDTSVTGAVEVEGAVDITGAMEVTPELNVTGALTVEGETNMLGAVTIEGETNIAGALTLEGDLAAAGAVEVAGDVAVLGIIEGVVVPPI
jgi:hypothetical protein